MDMKIPEFVVIEIVNESFDFSSLQEADDFHVLTHEGLVLAGKTGYHGSA